jgi:catechol-2,3-dioxygenase
MAAVQRLNHAVLYVGNVARSVAFYTRHLGFEIRVEMRGAAFLRSAGSANDHDLGLFEIGVNQPGPQQGRRGLYHLAWQVDTIDDLAIIRASLLEAGSLVGESDHGASKSLYAHDPDGIEFEVMWATPQSAMAGVGAGVARLDLDGELARWAGTGTGHEANVPASGTNAA